MRARMPITQETLELYQHTRQPHWGLATPISIRGTRARYQFEDGKVREFRLDTPLLRRVRARSEDTQALERLTAQLNALEAAQRQRRARAQAARKVPTKLGRPLRIFKKQYPRGFRGINWKVKVRGYGANRRLKRHREPAVLGAQQRLDGQLLTQLVSNHRHDEIHRLAIEVFEQTNLVHHTRYKQLAKLDEGARERFAECLTALLHDQTLPLDARFDAWVEACQLAPGQAPPWEVVTLPLALVLPEEHVCVNRDRLLSDAARLGIELSLPEMPNALAYREALGVVRGIRDACRERRIAPTDLLDVIDFLALAHD